MGKCCAADLRQLVPESTRRHEDELLEVARACASPLLFFEYHLLRERQQVELVVGLWDVGFNSR